MHPQGEKSKILGAYNFRGDSLCKFHHPMAKTEFFCRGSPGWIVGRGFHGNNDKKRHHFLR